MLKNHKTPRFEVDYRERLEQSRTASNAVRLPRLGYAQYRVYDIEEKKDKTALNLQYGQQIGRRIRTGLANIAAGSRHSVKIQSQWLQNYWAFVDELETLIEPPHRVKWLKPKQATFLRLQGHRVEEV